MVKSRFQKWVETALGPGVAVNPHGVVFPLVARVVEQYLKSKPGAPLGIFISDENREITDDVEKSIRLLRGMDGGLKLGQIIEKGFFIDSSKSLLLQLCDLCVFYARKKEKAKGGLRANPMDKEGISRLEALIFRGNKAFEDTMDWIISEQKKSDQGR